MKSEGRNLTIRNNDPRLREYPCRGVCYRSRGSGEE